MLFLAAIVVWFYKLEINADRFGEKGVKPQTHNLVSINNMLICFP